MTWDDFKAAYNFRMAEKCCENCKHGWEDFEGECYCQNPKLDEIGCYRNRGMVNNVCDLWERREETAQ